MQRATLQGRPGFRVLLDAERAQAAEMGIGPGDSVGGPDNRHRGADQWVFVVDGVGEATVDDATVELRAGTLLLIRQGQTHALRNTGERLLQTLNLYCPPAYRDDGEPLPAGRD